MLHHSASLDTLSAIVLALNFELDAFIHDVLVHCGQWNHQATVQDAVHNSVRTLMLLVLLEVLSDDLAAKIADLAGNEGIAALHYVFLDFGYFCHLRATFVWTSD